MEAITGVPDSLTSDAARSGSWAPAKISWLSPELQEGFWQHPGTDDSIGGMRAGQSQKRSWVDAVVAGNDG